MTGQAPAAATRRTQAERRAQTRALLITATIRAIAQEGYHATTTRRVAELAGSSLGALAHHFPSRLDLITAALDEVGRRTVEDLRVQTADLPADGPARYRTALDAIWAYFSGELFVVWLHVWIAAAEDPVLYQRLVPLQPQLSRAISTATADLAPAGMSRREWNSRLTVALDAMRGLALRRAVEPHEPAEPRDDPWPGTRDHLAQLLSGRSRTR
ncbi:TetR/AcrR family transcriptional regulator [Amycolatopsis orientalis]|uniref:TetR/AcrR family transcriptional regulator n=1 Tax=Amycolatopsis orientalis TaxID=31958 RepID=UPI0004031078|nr:TetR/AcrR family transcriptional regulator [Amycolatopsis orientalis]